MAKMKPHVVVIGSCYADMAVRCDNFPDPGETVTAAGFSLVPTGSGVNQALELAYCGCEVSFIGKIGSGCLGKMIKEHLDSHGVNTELLEQANAKNTGVVMTFVNSIGENCSCISHGANLALQKNWIESVQVEQAVSCADVCLIDGSLPREVVETALQTARLRRTPTILSLRVEIDEQSNAVSSLPISYTDADIVLPEFISNQKSEEVFFTNSQNFQMVGASMIGQGFKTVVINTLKKGCYIFTRQGLEQINSYDIEILDSTCCKDAFAGALAASIAAGDEIVKAAKFAYAAALITGSRLGGQETLPNKEDILKLLFSEPD